MAVLEEGKHSAECFVSEANGGRSREAAKLASGNDLEACAVLGQVTSASDVTADGGNVGDGTSSACTLGTQAINGTYTLTCTAETGDAGTFSVVAPNGEILAELTVGVAYVSSHINLTISDGSEDFDIGDIFTVDAIFGEYAIFDPAASDGTQTAKAVLRTGVDASTAEQNCVVWVRDCELRASDLGWISGITEVQKRTAIASLATVGIILR